MPIMSPKFESMVVTGRRLFARENYESISTAEIAKTAGITEPLIYYHFGNKSGCYVYIMRGVLDLYQDMLNHLAASGHPGRRLDALIDAHHGFARNHPLDAVLVFRPLPCTLESGREDLEKQAARARNALKESLAACLRDGIADGSFVQVSIPMTVDLLTLLLLRMLEQALDKKARIAASALKAFCRRGLATSGPQSARVS
jgi:AcrR family transcriptional regulator